LHLAQDPAVIDNDIVEVRVVPDHANDLAEVVNDEGSRYGHDCRETSPLDDAASFIVNCRYPAIYEDCLVSRPQRPKIVQDRVRVYGGSHESTHHRSVVIDDRMRDGGVNKYCVSAGANDTSKVNDYLASSVVQVYSI